MEYNFCKEDLKSAARMFLRTLLISEYKFCFVPKLLQKFIKDKYFFRKKHIFWTDIVLPTILEVNWHFKCRKMKIEDLLLN